MEEGQGCPRGGRTQTGRGRRVLCILRGTLHYFDSSQGASLVLRSKIHEKIVTAVSTGHLKKKKKMLHISRENAVAVMQCVHYGSKLGTSLRFSPSLGHAKCLFSQGSCCKLAVNKSLTFD